ncbi:C-terminal, D2-small domain-containing protein, of ClpB protein [Carboxydocella thermautotrophica]|nr:C-terminal, D2-small domain-containing protein, of ClpB protein [Carboxydocella thermautotrophica]
MDQLKHTFRPEFLNRIDEIIVFHPLEEEHIQQIVDLMLAALNKRLQDFGVQVEVTPAAKEVLVKKGYDPAFGARPLRRAIQRMVEDQLSEELLKGTFALGDTVIVDAEDGRLTFRKKA